MTKAAMKRFLQEYPAALSDGVGAVFVGAGMSMAAGYPSWAKLLCEIGEESGVNSRDIHDLAALAQWNNPGERERDTRAQCDQGTDWQD